MSSPNREPSFAEVVARIDRQFFGRHGVFAISQDKRSQTVSVFVDEKKASEFNIQLRKDIEKLAGPYTLLILFEPPARALSGRS